MTFAQARSAKAAGFVIEMRVKIRADAGGHSASEVTLRGIYGSSIANLPRAVAEIDDLWVYDNSPVGGPPELVMEAENGIICFLAEDPPHWLASVLDLP